MSVTKPALKIGIVGAGFTGTVITALLARFTAQPIEIFLIEKRGRFGVGEAYSTPYAHHLLNVRAQDMSAFEDDPHHFLNWLAANSAKATPQNAPLAEQFLARRLYGNYLTDILKAIHTDHSDKIKLHYHMQEVVDIKLQPQQAQLVFENGATLNVDKVVLALGNHSAATFPFPLSPEMHRSIIAPWDYTAVEKIPATDPVLIVGTGLSMIDAVLSLKQQNHQGKITALSRHGRLPLPHAAHKVPSLILREPLPVKLNALMHMLREDAKKHVATGYDWRSFINALRLHAREIWQHWTLVEKRRFIRHVMPYWNIHRHRVPINVASLLKQLEALNQLEVLSGRLISVADDQALIRLRNSHQQQSLPIKWLINCMGPQLNLAATQQPLQSALLKSGMASTDSLGLGLAITESGALVNALGEVSSCIYTAGSLTKGTYWEVNAVPEIRKQCFNLARHLLDLK